MDGSDQVAAAIRHSLAVAHDAAVAAGARPGLADYLERAAAALRQRQAAVWLLPADPDELLRHVEADCYQVLLDEPTWLAEALADVGKGDRSRVLRFWRIEKVQGSTALSPFVSRA